MTPYNVIRLQTANGIASMFPARQETGNVWHTNSLQVHILPGQRLRKLCFDTN
uniref:Uncharacterized protein n=1 Tax=Anguilla anguilla TaxID=7936 RepID=A0A0E9SD67_ANGAN